MPGLLSPSVPSRAPLTPATARRGEEPTRTRVRDQHQRRAHPHVSRVVHAIHVIHVINDELFRDVLIRERKRADRFDQPLALLLVTGNTQLGSDSSSIWASAIEALAAATRETDILGWFEPRALLGVILPEIAASDGAITDELEARVRRELAERLDAAAVGKLSIRLYVHRPRAAGAEGLWPMDPLPFKRCAQEERTAHRDAIKRGFDVIGSLILLLTLSPLFLLIAALVKLKSPGAALFRQMRVGRMAKPFAMLKFRTMHADAGHDPHHEFVTSFIKSSAQLDEPGNDELFKLAHDPRITPLGRILRTTSLDELPQLWNVLRGEMSLVGPRPPLPYEVEQYQPWHWRRVLEAKPGITGLWQVAGRSRTTFDDMVRLDLRYVRTCSLWTDIKILLATPAAVISGKGAS